MVKKIEYFATLLIFIFTSSGCATIAHGTSTSVRINSVPQGATAIVGGKTIIIPNKVILKNNQRYTIIFKKDGYEDTYFTIDKQPSGWVWANIPLGVGTLGLGAFIGITIDNATGGAFKLVPKNVNVTLIAKQEKK